MTIKKGFVYVISTKNYFEQNIFKIGFAKCIKKRLSQFNNTRTHEDVFVVYLQFYTIKYKKLETLMHQELASYRLNNEFFKVSLEKIQQIANQIMDSRFFKHEDVLFDNAVLYNLVWVNNHWSFYVPSKENILKNQEGTTELCLAENGASIEMSMSDANLIDYIKIWLQPHDRHNLYKFLSDDYYQSLLSFLKTLCSSKFSERASDMFLDPLCELSESISKLTLQISKYQECRNVHTVFDSGTNGENQSLITPFERIALSDK